MTARSLQRRPAPNRRPQRREFLVVAEGSKTEVIYVKYWERECRDRVLVHVPEVNYTDPMSLVREAVRLKRESEPEARRGRGRSYDEVWCIFDVDEHPFIPAALNMAQANGVRVAISNPCIELWFVLHLQNQGASINKDQVQRSCHDLLHSGKSLTDDALLLLKAGHADAMNRARELTRRHESAGSKEWENPSSTVWELIEAMRSASSIGAD